MVTSWLPDHVNIMPTPIAAHPLELIAPFRRWRPSPMRNLVYTALWNSLIGLLLALGFRAFDPHARFAALLGTMVLSSNLVGFTIHFGLFALRRFAPSAAPGRRSAVMRICEALLIACCAVSALALADALLGGGVPFGVLLRRVSLGYLPSGLAIALAMVAVLAAGERRLAREKLAARQEQQIAEAGRLLAEARLRALQAQIEPHFLYNTLANVVSLIGPDPDRARHMLERLIDFLRASLAASRAGQASVGAELDLAGAYLDLLGVRLGARLRYRIDADAPVRALALAPMLLQPLVENAVMHGIEPALAGGEIVVRARADAGRLCIEVSDDGAGLGHAPPRPGGGVGLANLRERLRSLHPDGAQLQLLENPAGGVTARLLLPLPEVPPSPPSAP
jgi:signal transduction histidine kinase